MRAKLAEVKTQLKRRMHDPIPVQGRWLARVLQGHVAYYAVPGNSNAVSAFRYQVSCTGGVRYGGAASAVGSPGRG